MLPTKWEMCGACPLGFGQRAGDRHSEEGI